MKWQNWFWLALVGNLVGIGWSVTTAPAAFDYALRHIAMSNLAATVSNHKVFWGLFLHFQLFAAVLPCTILGAVVGIAYILFLSRQQFTPHTHIVSQRAFPWLTLQKKRLSEFTLPSTALTSSQIIEVQPK